MPGIGFGYRVGEKEGGSIRGWETLFNPPYREVYDAESEKGKTRILAIEQKYLHNLNHEEENNDSK